MLTQGVIAVDNGGHSTGVMTRDTIEVFPSVKGLYGERKVSSTVGKYDYVVEYKGKKYVMGTLAKYDCDLPLQMHTDTKQNLFFDLSILTSIHQFGFSNNYLITSVPIIMHDDAEKNGLIKRLRGEHSIIVNGYRKTFNIMDVKVAPETAVAFWVDEPYGKSRFIDLGSRTIGYATTLNEDGLTRFIDSESGTFKGKGLEALSTGYNQEGLADYICGRLTSRWSENDVVYLLGGGALDKELVKHISKYFPKAKVMTNPQLTNTLGMYLLGRKAYDMA